MKKTAMRAIAILAALFMLFACALPAALGESAFSMTYRPEEIAVSIPGGNDNDAAFAAYVNGLFYPETTRRVSASHLSGVSRLVYDRLRIFVSQVAAGEITSTVFTIPFEDVGVATRYTPDDLGMPIIIFDNGTGSVNQDAVDLVYERISLDANNIISLLMEDAPYELYWYDKTVGARLQDGTFNINWDDSCQDYAITIGGGYTFSFTVASGYAQDTYTVNASGARAAQAAAVNAQAIVAKYASASDYEKLVGYKNEICALTDYNDDAAYDPSTPYGDPWQMIWVFDGDPNTTVVCEGYSKAFQYLCDMTAFRNPAINCYTVAGQLVDSMGPGDHMWNLIQMPDGALYLVDVTNSDDDSIGDGDFLFLAGTNSGSVADGYEFTPNGIWVKYVYGDKMSALFPENELAVSSTGYVDKPSQYLWPAAVNGVIYEKNGGELTASGYLEYADEIAFVDEVDGLPVTKIAQNAFAGAPLNGSVTLPQNLTQIGDSAFDGADGMTEIHIPASLTGVGNDAFSGCISLQDVYYGGSSADWALIDFGSGNEALTGASVHCTIPDHVHTWLEPVYTWSDDMQTVTAVRVCADDETHAERETASSVMYVAQSPTQTAMGKTGYTAQFDNAAFADQTVTVQDIPALGDMLTITLPDDLVTVGPEAFAGVPWQAVIVPEGCQEIMDGAFAGCDSLIYIRLSASTLLSGSALDGCGAVRIDIQ